MTTTTGVSLKADPAQVKPSAENEAQFNICENWSSENPEAGDSAKAMPRFLTHRKYELKNMCWGFPGGAVVENPPANAGDTGLSPGLVRSHMPWSNWAREPQLLSLRVWSLCPATREAATVKGPRTAMKSGPRLPQLEKALAQKRRPNTAKKKKMCCLKLLSFGIVCYTAIDN